MADRYVFSIHSKTKWGIDLGVSFFTCYCPSDQSALKIFEAVNGYLPNYAQLSLSKVLRESASFDIPDTGAQLTDVNVVSYLLSNDENPSVRKTIKIPLPFVSEGNSTTTLNKQETLGVLLANCCDSTGVALNVCMSVSDSGKNIVQSGAVPS